MKLQNNIPDALSVAEAVKLFDKTASLRVGPMNAYFVCGYHKNGEENGQATWSSDYFREPYQAWEDAAQVLGGPRI